MPCQNKTANTKQLLHYTRLMALCPGLPGWAGTSNVKPIWILLKHETVSGSGISWATCKSAPRSRQITTPAPHNSVFYRPDALPAAKPTASKHWRQMWITNTKILIKYKYTNTKQTQRKQEPTNLRYRHTNPKYNSQVGSKWDPYGPTHSHEAHIVSPCGSQQTLAVGSSCSPRMGHIRASPYTGRPILYVHCDTLYTSSVQMTAD